MAEVGWLVAGESGVEQVEGVEKVEGVEMIWEFGRREDAVVVLLFE